MKNSIKYLLSGICLIIVSINAVAESEQISIRMYTIDNGYVEDPPSKGARIPAPPIICSIDFEHMMIETYVPYEIATYELWDEYGNSTIVSYARDYELVEYMSHVSGVFQIRIVTTERTYLGYIDL